MLLYNVTKNNEKPCFSIVKSHSISNKTGCNIVLVYKKNKIKLLGFIADCF